MARKRGFGGPDFLVGAGALSPLRVLSGKRLLWQRTERFMGRSVRILPFPCISALLSLPVKGSGRYWIFVGTEASAFKKSNVLASLPGQGLEFIGFSICGAGSLAGGRYALAPQSATGKGKRRNCKITREFALGLSFVSVLPPLARSAQVGRETRGGVGVGFCTCVSIPLLGTGAKKAVVVLSL